MFLFLSSTQLVFLLGKSNGLPVLMSKSFVYHHVKDNLKLLWFKYINSCIMPQSTAQSLYKYIDKFNMSRPTAKSFVKYIGGRIMSRLTAKS